MSYAPKHDWSTTFAKQQENLGYMQQVAAELNVNPFVSFNTEVLQLTWDEPNSSWVIKVRHLVTGLENKIRADFVVCGTGPLALPKMPTNIPGIDKFKGRQCHTAAWWVLDRGSGGGRNVRR